MIIATNFVSKFYEVKILVKIGPFILETKVSHSSDDSRPLRVQKFLINHLEISRLFSF